MATTLYAQRFCKIDGRPKKLATFVHNGHAYLSMQQVRVLFLPCLKSGFVKQGLQCRETPAVMGSPADVAACKKLRMVHRQALYMRLIKASDVVDFIHEQHAKFDGRGKHRDKLLQQLEQHDAFTTMMHMPTPTPAAAAPAPATARPMVPPPPAWSPADPLAAFGLDLISSCQEMEE